MRACSTRTRGGEGYGDDDQREARRTEAAAEVTWADGAVRIELSLLDAQLVAKDYGKGNGPALVEMMQGIYDVLDETHDDAQ